MLPRVFAIGDLLYISAKVVNVENGRVQVASKSTSRAGNDAGLMAGLIAADVLRLCSTNLRDVAPSDDQKYAQTVADLLKLLGDRKRPTVTVVVPEEQLHRVIPDPAVKTELCYLLRKLHFRVIENDSPLLDQWVHDYFAGHASRFPAEVGDVDLVIYGERLRADHRRPRQPGQLAGPARALRHPRQELGDRAGPAAPPPRRRTSRRTSPASRRW